MTPRQAEILILIGHARTDMEISKQLGVSLLTVANHVIRIFKRIGVERRVEAAVWACRKGVLFGQTKPD